MVEKKSWFDVTLQIFFPMNSEIVVKAADTNKHIHYLKKPQSLKDPQKQTLNSVNVLFLSLFIHARFFCSSLATRPSSKQVHG